MASVAPPADQAADLLQKLSLDSQTKTLEVSEPEKKPSAIQYAPVNSSTLANGLNNPFERPLTPQDFIDPNMCYIPNGYPSTPYYYGGYQSGNDYSRYPNVDGVEMPPGVYGDNGSLVYPGYGYAPYGTYHLPTSPVPSMGHDAQLYGAQQYQYPTYYQSSTPTSGPLTSNQAKAPQAGFPTSTATDQMPLPVESIDANQSSMANVRSVNGTNGSKSLRPNYQNSSFGPNNSHAKGSMPPGTATGFQDQRYSFDVTHLPSPWLDASVFPDGKSKHALPLHGTNVLSGRNQNLRPFSHLQGLHHPRPAPGMSQTGFTDRMYPNNRAYGHYANTFRSSAGFGLNSYDPRISGRGWFGVDSKYKPKGRGNSLFGYGKENVDGLNELNRGPRTKGFKNQNSTEPITLAVKGQNITLHGNDYEDKSSAIPNKEQYNREDFPESYSDAKFFIIKSYSEDDVHKSIKYGVWASTPNGNKKLDAAYKEAQAVGCPIFLFFSVNASGQFVGLAEMVGTVDFSKSLEYWQQDKWTGCFPVKWHIVKDVPNSLLKHITLENNESKPVTNSRDTQEVKLEQGIEMLKIFKVNSSKTCILDDFGFYEARQKIMQDRKAKKQLLNEQMGIRKMPTDAVAAVASDEGKDGYVVKQVNGATTAAESVQVNGGEQEKN
ncbi:YTH domain-containing protein ECT4-like [Diospyros lotus]|uniref:YTH domain-containing protein ECT4-like n=1 Tax=Diospyros lotus TaxID=55363 RepID=UPI00225028CB|nr:YTH domain-containing protein ECT4-like [Diospyros lotus]